MEQIAINILPKGAKPVCHSSQFDEGRQIMFNLFNDKTPYTLSGTETISVLVRKPDGSEVVDSVTNTSDNYVIWDVSVDACELSGVCECELSIVENGIVLGSKNFTMKVEEDAYGGRTIEVRTASGRIATFSTNMVEAFKSLKTDINPVQSGTGTPSPQNVRPISGFSALNVTRCGKNLANVGYNEYYPLHFTEDKTIVASCDLIVGSPQIAFYDKNKTFIDYWGMASQFSSVPNRMARSFTYPSNAYYINFRSSDENTNYQIELGSINTAYAPYNGQTATVNFGQTVYGGKVDVTGGKVTKTHGIFSIPAATAFSTSDGHNYVIFAPNGMKNEIGAHYDILSEVIQPNGKIGDYFTIYRINTLVVIGVPDNYSLTDYNTEIAGTRIVYPLATPIEITTTPENLTALSGQTNNVYSDTNGDTTVEYYIEV